jgi:hypothetical protein
VVTSFPKKWRLRLPWYIFTPAVAVAGAVLPRATANPMVRSMAESRAPGTRVSHPFTKVDVWATEGIATDIMRSSLQTPFPVVPSEE